MITYPHFALSNLYLRNGYREVTTPYGLAHEYEREDELEKCIRRVLLRKPEPFRGWDLRFLRRGLDLSQAAFGEMLGRDAQTIARLEKSSDVLPKFVDLTIRVRYAERFEPGMSVKELLSYVDGVARQLPEKIVLTLMDTGWNFDLETRIKYPAAKVYGDSVVQFPSSYGAFVVIDRQRKLVTETAYPDDDHYVGLASGDYSCFFKSVAAISSDQTSSPRLLPHFLEGKTNEQTKH